MIDVKQATRIAYDYFGELYHGEHQNLAVEAFELTDDGAHWKITLGFDVPGRQIITSGSSVREYKVLKIDAESGAVVAMHERSP